MSIYTRRFACIHLSYLANARAESRVLAPDLSAVYFPDIVDFLGLEYTSNEHFFATAALLHDSRPLRIDKVYYLKQSKLRTLDY